jgi:hypothetical protein
MSSAPPQPQLPRSGTPCLDRQIPFPPRNPADRELRWWQLALIAACLLFKTFFVIAAVWMLLVLIHEVGHLVGGWLVGFRFNYIRIGALTIERSGKITWHWTWHDLASGAAHAVPVLNTALRWRFCVYFVAGPTANLITAFCAFKIMPRNNSLPAAIGLAIFLGSAFMGFVNLLPVRAKTQMADGLKIWILLFTKKRRDRILLLLTFAADARRGDRKAFMTDSALEPSSLIIDGSGEQVATNWLAFYKATAAKDYELAGRCLENCLVAASSVTAGPREELTIEAALYQARTRKRPDLARQWLAQENSGKANPRRLLAEALVFYQENQYELAQSKVEDGLAEVANLQEGSQRTSIETAFKNLKEALKKHQAGHPAGEDPVV